MRRSCDLHHIDLQQQFGAHGASDRALTIKVPIWLNETNYECLVDTGASVSLLLLSVVVGLDLRNNCNAKIKNSFMLEIDSSSCIHDRKNCFRF